MSDTNKNIDSKRPESAAAQAARTVSLCADQINAAMEEAAAEIDTLAQSFLAVARHAASVAQSAGALPDDRIDEQALATLSGDSEAMQAAVREGIAALQVGDRLSQRLGNIRGNLSGLADLLRDGDLSTSASRWRDFLVIARAKYTMDSERQMFDTEFDECVRPEAPVIVDANEGAAPVAPVLFATDETDV